jgi:hypothetical protein
MSEEKTPAQRLEEIAMALKEGYCGHLIAQRDFWREASVDLMQRLDETDSRRDQWSERAGDAWEKLDEARTHITALEALVEELREIHSRAINHLHTWLRLHPDDEGGARVAAVYDILRSGSGDIEP